MGTGVRREGQQARRRAVLGAARELFLEQGYDATTIREIAERAAVSVGTVMAAGDKASLLLRLMEEAIEEHIGTPEPQGSDAAELIWQRLAPFFDLYAAMPDLARAYGRVLFTPAARTHQALTLQAERFGADIAGDLRRCHPEVAESDATHVAEAIFACYLRAVITWGSEAISLEDAVAALREQIRWQLDRFRPPPTEGRAS